MNEETQSSSISIAYKFRPSCDINLSLIMPFFSKDDFVMN